MLNLKCEDGSATTAVASTNVTVPFDDNDKKSTSVYREKLYQEVSSGKGKGKGALGSVGQPEANVIRS